ncbi:MAG: Uma2 family endonuclease [Chloroflexia bacterium]|nr:Uma2 family endonuclease [Chloroflexia bacterium]
MATSVRLTAADLAALPDDGWRYELIRGELQRMAPDNVDHGLYGDNIQFPLSRFVRQHRLGRVMGNVGFTLESDPDTVLGPDVSFVRADRLPARGGCAFPRIPPDLAVEVLSPSNSASEIGRKLAIYLAAGVRLVWVIDSETRTVAVHSPAGVTLLGEGDTLDGGDVLPGFSIPVADLFA